MSEQLAERFHEIYESCAHDHGYETRKDSAVPWGDVPQKNKALMIYVCGIIEKEFIDRLTKENEALKAERDRLRPALKEAYESLQTCCLTTGSQLDILIFKAINHEEG